MGNAAMVPIDARAGGFPAPRPPGGEGGGGAARPTPGSPGGGGSHPRRLGRGRQQCHPPCRPSPPRVRPCRGRGCCPGHAGRGGGGWDPADLAPPCRMTRGPRPPPARPRGRHGAAAALVAGACPAARRHRGSKTPAIEAWMSTLATTLWRPRLEAAQPAQGTATVADTGATPKTSPCAIRFQRDPDGTGINTRHHQVIQKTQWGL